MRPDLDPESAPSLEARYANASPRSSVCVVQGYDKKARMPPHAVPDGRQYATAAPRMPSLNAIRAFEALARTLSYKRAAAELHVTASAVSHQIKALEEYFGMPLLRMANRQLCLTPVGEKYFRQISQGLTQVFVATQALLQGKGARVLRISAPPNFATWWLTPRLGRFFSTFPGISLEISATAQRTDFAHGHHDVAVRYSRVIENGLHATQLSRNDVFPVCSPGLMVSRALTSIHDLDRHTLISTRDGFLHDEAVANWEGWLRAARYPEVRGAGQMILSPRGVMLQAVAQGLGVGLARTLLATEALAARQLVCPFGPALPLAANYYVVCPQCTANDPDIVAFRDWLAAEAQASAMSIEIPSS